MGFVAGSSLVAAGGGASASVLRERRATGVRRARNVIFMVSDGMSAGTWTLADLASRRLHDRPSAWARLMGIEGVRRSMCMTASANSIVTDSAAAATAWSVGERVNSGALCITPDGRAPTPILIRAKERGMKTGVVTTTTIPHATPAGFVVNIPRRAMYLEIAEQMVEREIDLMLGGGVEFFPDELLSKHDDMKVVRDAGSLRRMRDDRGGRLLGMFNEGHLPYERDRTESVPSLAEMTELALARLHRDASEAGAGFFVQIEGGRVDHAAHGNDAVGLVFDQLAFDGAVEVAMRFALERDDTLLLVTTDHANANPGIGLYMRAAENGFQRLLNARHTASWIRRRLPGTEDESEWKRLTHELVLGASGCDLSEEELGWLARERLHGERVHGFDPLNGLIGNLGAVLANHYAVSFMSPNHTSDMIELTAFGPGAELLEPVCHLADVSSVVTEAASIPA